MTKIVITNFGSRLNKGSVALLSTTIKALKERILDAEFTVFTYDLETNFGFETEYIQGIPVKFQKILFELSESPRKILRTIISISRFLSYVTGFTEKMHSKGLEEYKNADVIINTGGDVLTEDYGSRELLNYVLNLMLGVVMRKPVVLYAESIGPFKSRWNRYVAKFLLDRVTIITLRERISKEYLERLNVRCPMICVTADSAFLLEPASDSRVTAILLNERIIKDGKPLVGISVNKIISNYGFSHLTPSQNKYQQYVILMAQVVDYLIGKLDASIVFLPHVIGSSDTDDRIVANDIVKLVRRKKKCIVVNREYTAAELKGVIGKCDMFIGARMHATIASTSMGVPTIAVAYSVKTYGIIGRMLGQTEYVLDVKSLNYGVFTSKIDDVWGKREEIRSHLKSKVSGVRELARLNAEFVGILILQSKK